MLIHNYARIPFTTDVGPKGGERLHLPGHEKPMRDTARNRNTRLPFEPKQPGDVKWKSHGSGVVYEPARGISWRKYRVLELERVARELPQPYTPGMTLIRACDY